MFIYGGLLKLLGDLMALIGPLSITLIVQYIEAATANDGNVSKTQSGHAMNATGIDMQQDQMENNTIVTLGHFPTDDIEQEHFYPDWRAFITNGWIMSLIVLISSLAQGSFSQASTHIVNIVGIQLRCALQGLVYRKTLLISSSCFFGGGTDCKLDGTKDGRGCRMASGDSDRPSSGIDIGSITNLMSEDALNVMSFFWIAHYVWAIPLKVGDSVTLNGIRDG